MIPRRPDRAARGSIHDVRRVILDRIRRGA